MIDRDAGSRAEAAGGVEDGRASVERGRSREEVVRLESQGARSLHLQGIRPGACFISRREEGRTRPEDAQGRNGGIDHPSPADRQRRPERLLMRERLAAMARELAKPVDGKPRGRPAAAERFMEEDTDDEA